MNRFDRITALLIMLQSKKVIKAQEMADRFGTSLRTIYRDIRTLEEAGVPLYGEAGVGYSIVDGYKLPPVMFTREEAIAFITAEKIMQKFSDTALTNNFGTAMYKIRAVLRSDEKNIVESLDNQIIVRNSYSTDAFPNNSLEILLNAISNKKCVTIEYQALGKAVTERTIEPIGIFHENDCWYTIAYCHLREQYRQFRADRLIKINLTNLAQKEHTSLRQYMEESDNEKTQYLLKRAVIRIDKNIVPYLREQKHHYGFVSEVATDDYVDMTFLSYSVEDGLARWFLMFADHGDIIEPQSLKDAVAGLLEKILERTTGSVVQ